MTRNERIKIKKTVKILGYISFVLILMIFIPAIIAVFVDNLTNKLVIYEIICMISLVIFGNTIILKLGSLQNFESDLRLKKHDFYYEKMKRLVNEGKITETFDIFFDKLKIKRYTYPLYFHVALGFLLAKIENTEYYEIFKNKLNEK